MKKKNTKVKHEPQKQEATKPMVRSFHKVAQPTSAPSSWANLFVKETPTVEEPTPITAPIITAPTELKEAKRVVQQYDMNKLIFKYTRSAMQSRGLTNRNNSCYINATLQALLYVPSFYHLLMNLNDMQLDPNQFPLTRLMIRFVKEFGKTTTSFLPEYILEHMIKHKPKTLKFGDQHDAQEFLLYILQTMHEELKQEHEQEQEDDWQEIVSGKKNTVNQVQSFESPISRLFGGYMRSQVKKRNKQGSLTKQPYYIIHLPIHDGIDTVSESLHELCVRELVTDSNLTKQISLETVPPVLILHLERFTYHDQTIKITRHIKFEQTLVLDGQIVPFSKIPEKDYRRYFELVSVVCHHGNKATGGHYTAHVKANKWVHIDDTLIEQETISQVLDQQAYMLIYQKKH
jgi:ubiquitin carboxyl-terminal hydrolase 10